MKRAGLEGKFDMTKVLNVLAGCSRDAMSARQEHTTLFAKQQSGGDPKAGAKGGGAEHEGERDEASPHPGDEGSLRRWEELLRSAHVNGGRWRPGVIEGGVTNAPPGGTSTDTDDASGPTPGTASSRGGDRRQQQQQQHEPLVPKGLDLLPSMRAPRYMPRPGEHADISGSGAAAKDEAQAIEYVPWVVGSGSSGRVMAGHTGGAATPMPAAGGVNDRVQWFPRGLPKESVTGMGQDERESALFNTRASMAIDRLGEQVEETSKRQAEMEIRRLEKVGEAVSLVRAAADHEKVRQDHFRRMKALRAQLESLEGTKGPSSPNGQASDTKEQDANEEEEERKRRRRRRERKLTTIATMTHPMKPPSSQRTSQSQTRVVVLMRVPTVTATYQYRPSTEAGGRQGTS
ncbi:unnamed protein product [Ectocarpus sp. 8 AP-2014]